ncbi:MAG: hypothetical protein IJ323_05305 [Clostridia bacterium]|nr:hypothetical protein [Clostridia bacterium]MBQ7897825.1 hypothetical protein [Clostridia bacterium]
MKLLFLFFKRNFKHLSFIFILLLMPLFTFFMKEVINADDSALKIGYTASGTPDGTLCQVFSKIEEDDGVIHFTRYESKGLGEKALEDAAIDSLWIFDGEFEEALDEYYNKKRDCVITVLNREENEMQDMALEKLFCFIYPHLSFTLFEDYMKSEIEGGDKLSHKELKEYYGYKGMSSEIVEIRMVDNSGNERSEEPSFILTALRGILSLMVLLSALSSALFLKEDGERGLFLQFKPLKRVAIYFEATMSALIPTGAVFFLSVLLSGTFTGFLKELFSLLVLLLTSASLSVALLTLCPSKKALCVTLPITLTASAVLSPIFLNVRAFPVIQSLFPTYHYLYSLTDYREFLYSLIYFALTTAVAFSAEYFYCRKR